MFKAISILTSIIFLTSCQRGYNKWTDNDCQYVDYYQSPPLTKPDTNYYHSDPQ